jgi:hypothetical protein
MFLGHYAVAFGAKKAVPAISLGTLLLSAQLADLLWPVFLLVGLEHVRVAPGATVVSPLDFYDYPITHSLIGALGWSLVFGFVYLAVRRYPRGAWVLAAGVLSHWVLDLIVHRPDLPLVPGGMRVGLGLWNSLPGTLVVELGLYVLGIALYVRTTRAADRVGRYALWVFVALLVILYLGSVFSPPPPSDRLIAIAGLGQMLFVLWAYWIDAHRSAAPAGRAAQPA